MSVDSLTQRDPLVGWPGAGAHAGVPGRPAPRPSWLRRRWRHLASGAVLAAAAYFLAAHTGEVRAASGLLSGLRWPWICVAVLCEAGSMLVLARLQRRLLQAGGVQLSITSMLGLTMAANAMDATLPGGVAWSAAWMFAQLSRHGVSRAQRVWMFLAAGAVSSFTLFLVVAAGVELAGAGGPMAGLRIPVLILAAIPLAGAGWLLRRRVPMIRLGRRAAVRLAARSPFAHRFLRVLAGFAARLATVRLSPGGWADALAMGLVNWLLDAAVLVVVLQALGIGVPWRAVLVIYGVTQVAGSLPVTPGGLGVVEASLAGLLAAYGTGGDQALAAVMLYRLVSFWGMVPAGWLVWLRLTLRRPAVTLAGRRRTGPAFRGTVRISAATQALARAAMTAVCSAAVLALPGAALVALPGAGATGALAGGGPAAQVRRPDPVG